MVYRTLTIAVCLALYSAVLLPAQTGRICGTVSDSITGEVLSGATVQIVGTSKGVFTKKNGAFEFSNLKDGRCSIRVSYVGYHSKHLDNVLVVGDSSTLLHVELRVQQTTTQGVMVEAARATDNAVGILHERKSAAGIADGIAKEDISKNGDATAGQAISRVTGVTLVEGKYITVRGASDRYNATMLNGAQVATTEPDKKSFAFDMLPSHLLERVNVVKTFTPDLPGSFVGGLVQMHTVDFPAEFTMYANYGFSGNDQITFRANQLHGSPIGPTDWIGTDGGFRAAPTIPSSRDFAAMRSAVRAGDQIATEKWTSIGRGFNNALLGMQNSTAPPTSKMGLSVGDLIPVGDEARLGVVGALNYGNNYQLNSAVRRGIQADGTSLLYDYQGTVANRSTDISTLLNLAFKADSLSTLSWKNSYNIGSDDESVYQYGLDVMQSLFLKNTSSEYLQRNLFSSTLNGKHTVPSLSMHFDWLAGYSTSARNQPDYRRFRYQRSIYAPEEQPLEIAIVNSGVTTQGAGSNAGRFYSSLHEYTRMLSLNTSLDMGTTTVKAGGTYSYANRDFSSRSFTYIQAIQSTIDYDQLTYNANPWEIPDPTDLFADSNFSVSRLGVSEDSRLRDSYTANEQLTAAYVMADARYDVVNMPLRVVAGARVESSQQRLHSYNEQDQQVNVNLNVTDVLPALSATLSPIADLNLRLAVSQTLSRPSLREFAPFAFFDFQTQSTMRGNPNLTRALVQNYDLRAEWFLSPGEVVSSSLFYKRFRNAIEETVEPTSSELVRTFKNAEQPATIYGAEFDIRKHFGFLSRRLQYLYANANVAIVHSEVAVQQGNVVDTRRMWGQSPYTITTSVSYENPDWGSSINIVYSTSGRRIVQVAQLGMYQIPVGYVADGPHVYENPRDLLSLTVSQRLGNFDIKVAASNILNSARMWEQLGQIVASTSYGVGYSCSVTYRLN